MLCGVTVRWSYGDAFIRASGDEQVPYFVFGGGKPYNRGAVSPRSWRAAPPQQRIAALS